LAWADGSPDGVAIRNIPAVAPEVTM
jgi:hypothetical protein